MTEETISTGVMTANKIPYLWDDMNNMINLSYEEWLIENSPTDDEKDLYCGDNDTYIIGYKLDESTGKYEIDEAAEYSAIISEQYVQVTHSKVFAMCNICSPCFPFQNDLETPGENKTYALPLDLFDDFGPCPYEVI